MPIGKPYKKGVNMDSKTCWKCGKQNPTMHFDLFELEQHGENLVSHNDIHQREYCEDCFKEVSEQYYSKKAEYIRLKHYLMFERAIRMFERQNADAYEYKQAIEAVQEFSSEHPEKFESSHEILAAIILVYNEIAAHVQYNVGKYRVDFCIPQLKIILEIDGYMHEYKPKHDNNRDIDIRNILGKDWETIRIPTKYIEKNAELLVEAIKTMKSEIQKIRADNYGMIPEWFSKRNKAK
jgi:very-short-patch-repair endonuclease